MSPDGAVPTAYADDLPWITVAQMVEADRLAIEEFRIGLLQMMEHAGSRLADLTDQLAPSGAVTVMAGGGNNGAGGLCAARHLVNRGRTVEVVLASTRQGDAAAHHLGTLAAMGISPTSEPSQNPVVIDAMVGYGLEGPLRGRAAQLAAVSGGAFKLSLDIPSGHGAEGAVHASATLTLALPKRTTKDLDPLYLADLGLPDALWARMGIETEAVFARGPILRIVAPDRG